MTDLTEKTLKDRYFLRKKVGSGGMADVYQAWDTMRSTRLAVKVLRRDLVGNPRFFKMFTQEASFYRKLEHPNIVRLYGFEKDGDIAFIIMDWIEGTSLSQAVEAQKGPFSLVDVSQILSPVCSALQYAHQKQVFHCDVKPGNILLHKDGKVLLTDFGVARLASESSEGGTASFMAPEQFTTGGVDARTDIYALGIVSYVMLGGGELPFQGNSSQSRGNTPREKIAWEHQNLPLPPLSQVNPQVPMAVETVVSTALSKDPADRYASTMDFRESFEHACLQRERGGKTPATIFDSLQKTLFQNKAVEPKFPPRARKKEKRFAQPHLYCRSGELSGQVVKIPPQGLSIGRSSRNHLQLRERSVSRMHALVWLTPQGTYIRDENSSLGTFVNNQSITQPIRLQEGDIIQIGYYQIFEYRAGN